MPSLVLSKSLVLLSILIFIGCRVLLPADKLYHYSLSIFWQYFKKSHRKICPTYLLYMQRFHRKKFYIQLIQVSQLISNYSIYY